LHYGGWGKRGGKKEKETNSVRYKASGKKGKEKKKRRRRKIDENEGHGVKPFTDRMGGGKRRGERKGKKIIW